MTTLIRRIGSPSCDSIAHPFECICTYRGTKKTRTSRRNRLPNEPMQLIPQRLPPLPPEPIEDLGLGLLPERIRALERLLAVVGEGEHAFAPIRSLGDGHEILGLERLQVPG